MQIRFCLFIEAFCDQLLSPANGLVMFTDGDNVSSNANYSCDVGYKLTGDENRTCTTDGTTVPQWTGTDPTCDGITTC